MLNCFLKKASLVWPKVWVKRNIEEVKLSLLSPSLHACQQGFLFKLTDIKLNALAHFNFPRMLLLPRRQRPHGLTEKLIDDRRCPFGATGLGHLICVPSEPLDPVSCCAFVCEENNPKSSLRSGVQNQQAQHFSSHIWSRMCVKIHWCIRGA